MKILVIGATGMAGHVISLYLKEKGYDIHAFSRTPFKYCKNIIGDVFDTENFKQILIKGKYDIVINCVGILNKSAEENPSAAVYLNSYLPHFIVDTLKDTSSKLIHMSTDCVFAGNTGPYFENSFKDGSTIYDRTKALGEVDDDKNLTFRNSIIGPDMHEHGIGLFNWFMKQKSGIKGFNYAIWTGVTTLTLAKAMEKSIAENLTGIYNLVNNENISKFNLLSLFNQYFRNNTIAITPDFDFKLDKTLKNSRQDFSYKVPSYEQMIIEMKEWVYTHKMLYPHYI